MIVGVTGTQIGANELQLQSLRRLLTANSGKTPAPVFHELHHGMCIGADAQAHKMFREIYGPHPYLTIVGHPPINKSKALMGLDVDEMREAEEYLDRNRTIVSEVEALIVIPKGMTEEKAHSGTWATWRYAVAGFEKRETYTAIYMLWPNGEIGLTERGTW